MYPCQRTAAPFAGGFVVWLLGVIGSSIAWRRGREISRQSPWRKAWLAFAVASVGAIAVVVNLPNPPVHADGELTTHGPLGVSKGIYPGRVVWVHAPDAVRWDGYDSPEHWWEPTHTDLSTVEEMMAVAIRGVAGVSDDVGGWKAIFRHFNQKNGKGSRGYQTGERITIKINLTACNAHWGAVDTTTYEKKDPNTIDNSPQMILALLRQLVYKAGVNQADISVGDPTGLFPNFMWNMLHQEFPEVHYFDNLGGAGRTRTEFSNVPIGWSTSAANGKLQDYLPVPFAEADYIINLAILKGHQPGVTLCAKNHYGSLLRGPDGFLRDFGYLNYYNLHFSLPLPITGYSPGMSRYRALVDLMGHPQLGGKTLLYLIDGLFGGLWGGDARPYKWKSVPFGDGTNATWPASLFASQDPVAIDSVAYDFLLNEWPDVVTGGTWAPGSLQGGAEDYLHEAALVDNPPSGTFYDPEKIGVRLTSLGVHEHWNNPSDKRYSRNLGGANGIELLRVMITSNQDYTVSGKGSVCAGSVDNIYTAATPAGATHSWAISGSGSLVGPTDGSSVTVAAGATGSFTIIDSVMLNGYDGAGSMIVTIDSSLNCGGQVNQPPAVTLTTPANGATFTTPATIDLAAAASDPDGTISKVEFYNGATLLGTATSAPYGYTWTGVAAGTYTLTARAYDNLGGMTSSTAATVSVTTPVVRTNVALATNGGWATCSSSGTSYPASAVNNGDRKGLNWGAGGVWRDGSWNTWPDWVQINFNGQKTISAIDVFTVQDNLTSPVEPMAGMSFSLYGITAFNVQYWDGTAWVTVPGGSIAGNKLVWRTITFPAVTTDRIRVVVNASLSYNSRITEIEAYTDGGGTVNQPPVVTLTAPATGSTFTAPATIGLTATAADPDGTISKVEFYNGATLLGTATTTPYGYTWTSVPAGTYTLTARAYDNLGATTTSTAATVTVTAPANQPPVVTLTAPVTGSTYTAPATIDLAATASDPDGSISKVEFYNGATLLGTATTTPYGYTWTSVPAGTYTLIARAYDNLGATITTTAVTVTVTGVTRNNVALATNGGVATTSSYGSLPPQAVIDGDRKGLNSLGAVWMWRDATYNVWPDWVQIKFNGQKTISEIDVFTAQTSMTSPVEPSPGQTFTANGITAFDVQYWDGIGWVSVPGGSITGNNLVWRSITFPAVTTDRIRVVVNASLNNNSRITEIEAY
jgi:hypothetical protein